MYCTKCGAKNDDDSRFCYSCGNALDAKAASVDTPNVNMVNANNVRLPEETVANESNASTENTYWENQSRLDSSRMQSQYQQNANQSQLRPSDLQDMKYSQPQPSDSQDMKYSQPQSSDQQNMKYSQPQSSDLQNIKDSQPQSLNAQDVNQYRSQPFDAQNINYNQPQFSYQQPVDQNRQNQYYGQQAPLPFDNKPKKKVKPVFILAPVIAVAAIVIIVIAFSHSNKGGGALDSILDAAQGTLNAGSFDFEAGITYTDDYGTDQDTAEGIFVYDFKDKLLEYDITADDERSILYDGTVYSGDVDELYYDDDASDDMEEVFDYYDNLKEGFAGLTKIDWEKFADGAGIPFTFDKEDLKKCIMEFEKNMNSTKYLESVCNKYTEKNTSAGTVYSFDVDVPEFVKSVVDTFEPVLEKYGVNNDRLEYSYAELEDIQKCLIEVTVKGGKLAAVTIEYALDDGTEKGKMELTLNNYGKASLDKKEIQKLIEDYSDYKDW